MQSADSAMGLTISCTNCCKSVVVPTPSVAAAIPDFADTNAQSAAGGRQELRPAVGGQEPKWRILVKTFQGEGQAHLCWPTNCACCNRPTDETRSSQLEVTWRTKNHEHSRSFPVRIPHCRACGNEEATLQTAFVKPTTRFCIAWTVVCLVFWAVVLIKKPPDNAGEWWFICGFLIPGLILGPCFAAAWIIRTWIARPSRNPRFALLPEFMQPGVMGLSWHTELLNRKLFTWRVRFFCHNAAFAQLLLRSDPGFREE